MQGSQYPGGSSISSFFILPLIRFWVKIILHYSMFYEFEALTKTICQRWLWREERSDVREPDRGSARTSRSSGLSRTHWYVNKTNRFFLPSEGPVEFLKNTQSCQRSIPIYLLFLPLFDYYDFSKCEILFERIPENYISRFYIPLVCFICRGTTKTKLATLEIFKSSIPTVSNC